MLDWRAAAAVVVGGGIGSLARYAIQTICVARIGTGFPWATFGINVAGSFCIGLVAALAAREETVISPLVRIFLTVGVLGGFTTFSTFSLETLALVRAGLQPAAIAYAAGSVLLGYGAAWLGTTVGSGGTAG